MTVGGVQVYVTSFGFDRVQVRFPRSKRKRIRRKWARNARNWAVTPRRGCYALDGAVFCDSVTFAELRAANARTPAG